MTAFSLARRSVAAVNARGGVNSKQTTGIVMDLIPGEALTAYLTLIGIGALIPAKQSFAASSPDAAHIWAWISFGGGLIVGLAFSIGAYVSSDATNKPHKGWQVLTVVLSVVAYIAIVLQSPANPFFLQFHWELWIGSGCVAFIAVVILPILIKSRVLHKR